MPYTDQFGILLTPLRYLWTSISKLIYPENGRTCTEWTIAERTNRDQETALKIIDDLQQQNWSAIRSQCTPTTRLMLPDLVLSKSWSFIKTTAGDYLRHGKPETSITGTTTLVKIPLIFSKTNQLFSLATNEAGQVTSFRIIPLPAAISTAWTPPPYADETSYREEAITLTGPKHSTSGTLIIPTLTPGPHPVVVMLSGSGPMDRDSTVGSCKPFADLALGLASRGIASLRWDKLGGSFAPTSTATDDVAAATVDAVSHAGVEAVEEEYTSFTLAALRLCASHAEIDESRVYLLGHSLGGYVAPSIAATTLHFDESGGVEVQGLILMAAPTRPLYRCAIKQYRYLASLDGYDADFFEAAAVEMEEKAERADDADLSAETPVENLPFGIGGRYWLDMRGLEPLKRCRAMEKMMLILQGGKDFQVTVDDDFELWEQALGGRTNVDMTIYEELNHLFIATEGKPMPTQYEKAGHVDQQVVEDISAWVCSR